MYSGVKLSLSKKLRYGIGDFGMSVIIASLQFYMLFYYTDVVGINPGIAGTAMLVGKLTWDMINDGLFGYLIDKTKSKWGRKRPYLLFCSVPLALSFWLLFSLPTGMSDLVAFFAIIGTFCIFDSFQTLVNVAYTTMTAELTTDYDERTNLATTRMIFNVVGYIFGAALMTLLAMILNKNVGLSDQTSWSIVGLFFGVIAAVSTLIVGFSKDLSPVTNDVPCKMPPIKSLISTFKNKMFVRFFIITMIMSIAFTLVTTMLPYYIIYQLDMEAMQSIIMMLLLVTLAIFLVPCKMVINKIGKGATYALGLAIASAALLVGFFLPYGSTPLIYGIAIVAGLGFSSQWVCPHSMMPDVIEFDELKTGERREGIFYGVWGMTGKVSGALGSAMCGWGLALFGYVKDVPQTDLSRLGIRLMFTVIPAVLLLVCVPMLIKYPITRESHAKVMAELAERRKAQ